MSLLFSRRAIEASVAGLLDPEADARLRSHLAGCDACRAHYDALVASTRALTEQADGTGAELVRAQARLLAALEAPPRARPSPARWLVVPAMLAAAAVAVVTLRPASDVVERGSADDAPAPFSVSLYARAKSGVTPVRLAAQFPESGEAVVSTDDWLQVKAPPDVVVVLVSDSEAPRRLESGSSESLPRGTVRLFGVRAPADEVLRAARGVTPAARRLPLPVPQVTGVLSVRP